MGRSVSSPSNARYIAYMEVDSEDFDWTIDEYRRELERMFPSVHHQDSWIGRENHVVAGNRHALFGLSEYCGLVAYWIVPQGEDDGREAMAWNWIDSIADKFCEAFGTLNKVGTASNGEAFFERRR